MADPRRTIDVIFYFVLKDLILSLLRVSVLVTDRAADGTDGRPLARIAYHRANRMSARRADCTSGKRSLTHQQLLRHILESDPEIEVLAVAGDGVEVVELARKQRPDLILMDIHMPRMNGLESTQRIMETQPTPIIIFRSSAFSRDVDWPFQVIEAGVLTFQDKPHGPGHPDFENETKRLIQSVNILAGVKVIRRFRRPGANPVPSSITAAGAVKSVRFD